MVVSGVEVCYKCLENCGRGWSIENCTFRYGEHTPTKCISAHADTGNTSDVMRMWIITIILISDELTRKQCMSDEQAESFCDKFNRYEDVTCYVCGEDLCNSGENTRVCWFFLLSLVMYVLVKMTWKCCFFCVILLFNKTNVYINLRVLFGKIRKHAVRIRVIVVLLNYRFVNKKLLPRI